MARFVLIDATDSATEERPSPEWIDAFVALGFESIGKVLPDPSEFDETLVEMFGAEHREVLRREYEVPTPVLASTDRTAFVEIGEWFGRTPSVRVRSALDDGSLVETTRRYDVPPPSVDGRVEVDTDETMTRGHVPDRGRSIEVVQSDSAADIWRLHREHLARYSSVRSAQPVDHSSVRLFIAIAHEAHEHEYRCMFASGRSFWRYWVPGAVISTLLAIAATTVINASFGPVAMATVGLAIVAGATIGFARLFRRLPYKPLPIRLRPRYRLDADPRP